MSRTVCAVLLFFVIAAPCRGQQAGAKPELLIRLCVAPAKAPEPALKYLLLPDLSEMNPGNPILGYMKCFLEQYRFVFDEQDFDRRGRSSSGHERSPWQAHRGTLFHGQHRISPQRASSWQISLTAGGRLCVHRRHCRHQGAHEVLDELFHGIPSFVVR